MKILKNMEKLQKKKKTGGSEGKGVRRRRRG
jgi:hypothetical protein